MKNKNNISGKIVSSIFYLLLIVYTQCCFGFDFNKCVEFENNSCLIKLNNITLDSPTIGRPMAIEIADNISYFLAGKNQVVLTIKNLQFTPEAYLIMQEVFLKIKAPSLLVFILGEHVLEMTNPETEIAEYFTLLKEIIVQKKQYFCLNIPSLFQDARDLRRQADLLPKTIQKYLTILEQLRHIPRGQFSFRALNKANAYLITAYQIASFLPQEVLRIEGHDVPCLYQNYEIYLRLRDSVRSAWWIVYNSRKWIKKLLNEDTTLYSALRDMQIQPHEEQPTRDMQPPIDRPENITIIPSSPILNLESLLLTFPTHK